MKLVYQTFFGLSMLFLSLSLSATNITFQVDMSAETVSPGGVSVAYAPPTISGLGDVTVIALDDADGDGIYTGTSDVPHDTIGYFFINGMASNPANFEMVPEECGISVSLLGLTAVIRPYIITGEATLDVVCFASCGACPVTDCDNPAVVFTDDASTYDLGPLAPTGPWTAWPGGAAGFEIDTLDGDNVFSIIGNPAGQDAYFDTGDLTSGHYYFSWNQYIPAGNSAYFNIQHQDPTTTAGFWAFDVFFNGDGAGVLELNDNGGTGDTEYGFVYPEDEFFFVGLIIDLDNDQARLIVDEYTIASWVFSDGVTNGNAAFDLLQFSGINFYPIDATHVWYLDNMSWLEIPAAGPDQYCYTASVIEPGTHTVGDLSCFGGAIHRDGDADGTAAQWFQYTPAADGWISIGSCEGGSDSRGWILRGDCNSLEIIGVNDDQCAIEAGSDNLYASYREAVVQGGQTYYIMWDNVWDDAGFEFELAFNDTELVEGDFCESAAVIQPGTFDINEFTGNAAYTGPIIDNTSQGRSPTPYAQTEWYQYTPTVDGTITITSCELSASDNRVWVYTGECGTLSSLTVVALSDDDCGEGSFASRVEDFPVTAGTTYYIEWDNGWDSDSFGWELIFTAPVVTSDVTFQVDMNQEDISPDGVFIAGGFSDFMNVAMDDADADGIYTVTLALEDNTMYTYKFKNGNDGWENINTSIGDNCTTGDFADRFINTGDTDTTVDVVCFGYCVTCDLVDVDELTFAQSVDLFPNPTDGQLQVRINLPEAVDGLRLRVSSILGSTLIDRQLGNLSQYNEQIDLSTFPAGTYVVTLTNGSLQVNRKVVVK